MMLIFEKEKNNSKILKLYNKFKFNVTCYIYSIHLFPQFSLTLCLLPLFVQNYCLNPITKPLLGPASTTGQRSITQIQKPQN